MSQGREGEGMGNLCLATIIGRDSFRLVGGQCSSVVEQRFRKP